MGQPAKTRPPLRQLFAPGERIGWRFRDRRWSVRPFPEPNPGATEAPPALLHRHGVARSRLPSRLATAVGVWLGVTVLLGCGGACAGVFSPDTSGTLFWLTGLAFVGGLAAVGLVYFHHHRTLAELPRVHRQAVAAREEWQRRRARFERAEQERVETLPEWGAASPPPGTRRIDVVGGTLWGWEAFLTVFGASMLGTRGPLTVLDFSGEAVCAELAELAEQTGAEVDMQQLPSGLADSDLLVGLDAGQLVDALIEAVHGDTDDSRADRSMDSRLLGAVCHAIAPELTMARLAAALRALLGEPGPEPDLTPAERHQLGGLFSADYCRAAHTNLRRLEAHLHPLRDLGVRRQSRPEADVTCLMMDSDARSARNELLVDLVVQWISRRMVTARAPRTLVVAGADDLARRHLERLADICARRDIRLAFMFRHLRESSLQLLGGGAVAFMRLGNHAEAARAAEFIGRHHRFVLTQVTRTIGGSETHSTAEREGRVESEARPGLRDLSRPVRRVVRPGGTRQWSTTRSWAEGSNWSDAACEQRVYEYTVEPTTLQHLPDYAMLLIESRPGGPVVHPIECDPAILTLPRATHESLSAAPAVPGSRSPADGTVADRMPG